MMRSDRATEELWVRSEDEVLGRIGNISPWVTVPHSNTESRSLMYSTGRPEGRHLMEMPHLAQYTEPDSSPWQPTPRYSPYHNATTGAVYQEIRVHFHFGEGGTEEAREKKRTSIVMRWKSNVVVSVGVKNLPRKVLFSWWFFHFGFHSKQAFFCKKMILLSRYILVTDMSYYKLKASCCLIGLPVPPYLYHFVACCMEGEVY
jgi:hypothetical protein